MIYIVVIIIIIIDCCDIDLFILQWKTHGESIFAHRANARIKTIRSFSFCDFPE